MAKKLAPNVNYCLVLVDTLEELELSDDIYWASLDFTAFDVVVVARIEEKSPNLLNFVKGNIG